MYKQPHKQALGPVINRFADLMTHTERYAFKGVTRLARDARVSPSSVSRLINGKLNPSFVFVARLTAAIEKQLGFRIDPRDLIAERGAFLTQFACDLAGCQGCLPDCSHTDDGDLMPAFKNVEPGRWVTSRYPKGIPKKGDK